MSQTLSSSTYTLLQFIVFLVLLQCYPYDDNKGNRYMLIFHNTYFMHMHLLVSIT